MVADSQVVDDDIITAAVGNILGSEGGIADDVEIQTTVGQSRIAHNHIAVDGGGVDGEVESTAIEGDRAGGGVVVTTQGERIIHSEDTGIDLGTTRVTVVTGQAVVGRQDTQSQSATTAADEGGRLGASLSACGDGVGDVAGEGGRSIAKKHEGTVFGGAAVADDALGAGKVADEGGIRIGNRRGTRRWQGGFAEVEGAEVVEHQSAGDRSAGSVDEAQGALLHGEVASDQVVAAEGEQARAELGEVVGDDVAADGGTTRHIDDAFTCCAWGDEDAGGERVGRSLVVADGSTSSGVAKEQVGGDRLIGGTRAIEEQAAFKDVGGGAGEGQALDVQRASADVGGGLNRIRKAGGTQCLGRGQLKDRRRAGIATEASCQASGVRNEALGGCAILDEAGHIAGATGGDDTRCNDAIVVEDALLRVGVQTENDGRNQVFRRAQVAIDRIDGQGALSRGTKTNNGRSR